MRRRAKPRVGRRQLVALLEEPDVVVLNRLRYLVCGELAAQLREARRTPPQPTDLVALERQIALQEVLS